MSLGPLPPSVPSGINLAGSGRIAKVCPQHRRVLERADSGDGLMCPAGEDGWHLVDAPLSIDRHTGKEVEASAQVDRPEEEDVAKEKKGNACPGCGLPKRGPGASNGQPCKKCRGKGRPTADARLARVAARAAKAARARTPTTEAGATFLVIAEGPDLDYPKVSKVLFHSKDPELLRRVGEVMTQWLTEGVEAGLRVAGQISKR